MFLKVVKTTQQNDFTTFLNKCQAKKKRGKIMKNLTQKEIKQIKKEITQNGILCRGYWEGLKDIFKYDEIVNTIQELKEKGYNFFKMKDYQKDAIILTELISKMNYQTFKNNALQFIFI